MVLSLLLLAWKHYKVHTVSIRTAFVTVNQNIISTKNVVSVLYAKYGVYGTYYYSALFLQKWSIIILMTMTVFYSNGQSQTMQTIHGISIAWNRKSMTWLFIVYPCMHNINNTLAPPCIMAAARFCRLSPDGDTAHSEDSIVYWQCKPNVEVQEILHVPVINEARDRALVLAATQVTTPTRPLTPPHPPTHTNILPTPPLL